MTNSYTTTTPERDAELTAGWHENMASRLAELAIGARVRHAKFGIGTVIEHCAGKLVGETVRVRFDDGSERRILSYTDFGTDRRTFLAVVRCFRWY